MNPDGPRILLIGGTYRALCVLERLLERGERVAAFIGQEGGDERDFCPEILELCDRASIPARSGRKFGEEMVRWLEDRIRPELAIAIGISTEIPLTIGGNCRLGLLEVIDSFQVDTCPGVVLRQRGQDIARRVVAPPRDADEAGDVYMHLIDAAVDLLDEYLDRLGSARAEPQCVVPFDPEPLSAETLHDIVERPEPGEETERLEAELRCYLGADYVAAMSDPADAFALLAQGLGLAEGDQVIAPALVSGSAIRGLRRSGAEIAFADVDAMGLALDPDAAAEALTPRTRAIVIAHPFGQPAPLDLLYGFAEEHGLEVIEDALPSLGARFGSSRLGRSPCACVLGMAFGSPAPGTQVAFLTLPQTLAERLALRARELALGDGAARIARERFAGWEERLAARRANASHYSAELVRYDAFQVPSTPEAALPTYAHYLLRLTRFARCSAEDLQKLLAENGIESRRLGVPPAERELIHLPAIESVRATGLLLPVEAGLRPDQRDRLLDAIFDYAIG